MSMTTLNHNKKLSQALQILNDAAREKKEEIQENIVKFRKTAQKAINQSGQKIKRAASDVDAQVHKNPWVYIGSVAAGAVLLGFLLGKSRKK